MHKFKYKNLKFKYLINHIVIDLKLPWNFASMNNIKIKYNSTVDLSKFTFNKKKY